MATLGDGKRRFGNTQPVHTIRKFIRFGLCYENLAGRFALLYWDGNERRGGLAMGASARSDLYFDNLSGVRMGQGGGQTSLLERFMAPPTFRALYEETLRSVYRQVFSSGALMDKVGEYSDLIHAANAGRDLVDLEGYDLAVESTLTFLRQRMETFQATDLLSR
ncbi:MAG: CotH kinase family protein [Anaerolineales bacterium]|nr:CotH kinase family protein [Anaerolineales bacterium]